MKLSTGYLLALTSVSDAKKGGKKNKENSKKARISGESFGEHCLAEKNDNGILTLTTVKGLNEVTNCHREIRCPAGYFVERKIAFIQGLHDCGGCEPEQWTYQDGHFIDSQGNVHNSISCNHNYEHNVFRLTYRIGLIVFLISYSK